MFDDTEKRVLPSGLKARLGYCFTGISIIVGYFMSNPIHTHTYIYIYILLINYLPVSTVPEKNKKPLARNKRFTNPGLEEKKKKFF